MLGRRGRGVLVRRRRARAGEASNTWRTLASSGTPDDAPRLAARNSLYESSPCRIRQATRSPTPCHATPRPRQDKRRQATLWDFECPPSYSVKKGFVVEAKSLGAHSECNVSKKMHTLLGFRDPKSLGVESGDRSICVFAYLTALLEFHFPILQYLIWFLRGRCFSRKTT